MEIPILKILHKPFITGNYLLQVQVSEYCNLMHIYELLSHMILEVQSWIVQKLNSIIFGRSLFIKLIRELIC